MLNSTMRRYQTGDKMIHIPTQTKFTTDRPVRQKSTGLLYLFAGDDRYLAEECEFEPEEEFEEIPIEAKSVQVVPPSEPVKPIKPVKVDRPTTPSNGNGKPTSYPWGNMPNVRKSVVKGATFSPGNRVTNSSGWHGLVTRVEEKPANREIGGDGFYYWVHWHERTEIPLLSRKPEVGHLANQISLFTQ